MAVSLITKVEANDFDARAVHVATVSLAHKVMLLVVGVRGSGARIGCADRCWGRLLVAQVLS